MKYYQVLVVIALLATVLMPSFSLPRKPHQEIMALEPQNPPIPPQKPFRGSGKRD